MTVCCFNIMTDSKENDNEIMNKVKIFSSDDEKIKILGELLSNKSSRDIIKLLIDKEMYTNEIADKLDLRVNLVIHHLKKLEDLGLLQIQNKEITKKGITHKHYRINPYFFLAPTGTHEEIKNKGTLKKIFKESVKFLSVVAIGFSTFIIIESQKMHDDGLYFASGKDLDLTIPLSIIVAGLFLERIVSIIRKRKK